MSAPNFTPLEEALRQLHGGVRALMLIGVGAGDTDDGAAINFVADKMLEDVEAARAWFDAAHAEVKDSGPRAVS